MPMPRKVDPIAAQRTFDERLKVERRDFNQKVQLAKKDEKLRKLREENAAKKIHQGYEGSDPHATRADQKVSV
jgi:hypothetical protein